MYKTQLYFYTLAMNNQKENEIRKIILFAIESKRMKHLEINLTK